MHRPEFVGPDRLRIVLAEGEEIENALPGHTHQLLLDTMVAVSNSSRATYSGRFASRTAGSG